MIATALEAKAALEANGLVVSLNNTQSLLIARSYRDVGNGIRLSHDACALMDNGDHFVAVFPGKGLSKREVPGALAKLVPLILAVYEQYEDDGQADSFRIAVEQVLDQSTSILERPLRQAV